MDRQTLLNHLAEAERHVANGGAILERERAIVDQLRRDGHPTAESERLLQTLEESQQLHVAHRDRIRHELAELG